MGSYAIAICGGLDLPRLEDRWSRAAWSCELWFKSNESEMAVFPHAVCTRSQPLLQDRMYPGLEWTSGSSDALCIFQAFALEISSIPKDFYAIKLIAKHGYHT